MQKAHFLKIHTLLGPTYLAISPSTAVFTCTFSRFYHSWDPQGQKNALFQKINLPTTKWQMQNLQYIP